MKITVIFPALDSSEKIRFTKTIPLQSVESHEPEKLITQVGEEEVEERPRRKIDLQVKEAKRKMIKHEEERNERFSKKIKQENHEQESKQKVIRYNNRDEEERWRKITQIRQSRDYSFLFSQSCMYEDWTGDL